MSNIYSYHTFIFPFTWKDESNISKSFDSFTDVFESNPYWTCFDPKDENSFSLLDDEFSYYNEYQYFYPQIRSALYGFNENIVKTYHFAYEKIHNKAHYYIAKGSKTYDLLINSIHLKIYNTGIALFVMECENHGIDKNGNCQNTFSDVKNINDYGRRVTLPFIPSDPSGYSACADSLEVFVPELNKSFSTDFTSFINMIGNSEQKKNLINLNHLSSFIKGILGFASDYQFSSNISDEKKSVYVHPSLDDRMFVACLVVDKDETKNFIGDKKTEKCTSKGDSKKYPYEDDIKLSKSLYEFIFLDHDNDCTCQSEKMRSELLDKHIYKRWIESGSIYGVAAQSLVLLFNGGAMHLVGAFLTIYVRMACLCLAQKASLMFFQKETADLSRLIREKENKISLATVTKLMDLQERFSSFESQICFSEITPQEQGIELYSMFVEFFLIEKELENVKSQITSLHNATDTYLDFNFNRTALIFTLIGAVLGIIALIDFEAMPNFLILPVSGIVISAAIFIGISILYRRKWRK